MAIWPTAPACGAMPERCRSVGFGVSIVLNNKIRARHACRPYGRCRSIPLICIKRENSSAGTGRLRRAPRGQVVTAHPVERPNWQRVDQRPRMAGRRGATRTSGATPCGTRDGLPVALTGTEVAWVSEFAALHAAQQRGTMPAAGPRATSRQRNSFDPDTMDFPASCSTPPRRRSLGTPTPPSRHGERAAPHPAGRRLAPRRRPS